NPAFVARVSKTAKLVNWSLIFAHTHPGNQPPRFSQTDDQGETELVAFLTRRGLQSLHGALVLSDGGACARVLGTSTPLRVVSIAERLSVAFDRDSHHSHDTAEIFDRQVRALGGDGQRLLGGLSVGIVGLGGTGSIAAEQLAHLGVQRFV